jgi:endo-1,4-beta-xylanase
MKQLLALIVCITFVSACTKKSSGSSCIDQQGLYSRAKFPVGTAVNINLLGNEPTYTKIVNDQFNSITPENIFKPMYLHPGENDFSWGDGDQLAAYCKDHNKRLHGHVLIWHSQLPDWINNYEGDASAWDKLLKTHIQTIVGHFKGSVKSWDVINEAFNDDGTLRETIWKQHLGITYLEKAFRYAQEADPDVLLFYNDYALETNSVKRKSVIDFFNALRAHGVKVDGIGLQMHINTTNSEINEITEAMQDIAANKYKVHLSEIDVSINPYKQLVSPTSDLLNKQATLLGEVVAQYNTLPPQYQHGITFWEFSDLDSWLPGCYACLYDMNYIPKPAYCQLRKSL